MTSLLKMCVYKPNQSFCSDHFMITFNYSHRSSPPNFQQLPQGNSTNFVLFFPRQLWSASFLTLGLWISVFVFSQLTAIQSGLYTLKLLILNSMELLIPKVRLITHQHPIWFTFDICHSVNCLCTLRRKCKSTLLLIILIV